MTPAQTELVARRARLIRLWPVVGALVLVLFAVLYGFAFKSLPLDTEPAALAAKVQSGELDMEGMARMAIVGSVSFIACGVFIFTILVVITVSLLNEKRLIAIVREQESELAALKAAPVQEADEAPAMTETPAAESGGDDV